jgi:hypothetical protein
MAPIRFSAQSGSMGGTITDVPAFPGDSFGLGVPEAIGDSVNAVWFNRIKPEWRQLNGGVWRSTGGLDGALSYIATITPGEDTVDVNIALKNESDHRWWNGMAFNCFNCGRAVAIRDFECTRHWVRSDGAFRRLIEIPRKFGPRPSVQLYSVEGSPAAQGIPFVNGFQATPDDVALEGWLAIRSHDGKRLAAVASRPTLFLFQNMEYSCIHASPGFGPLEPGQTGEALTRLYFVESRLDEWHRRMTAEMAG